MPAPSSWENRFPPILSSKPRLLRSVPPAPPPRQSRRGCATRCFRFFSSVKLAVVLISVLILASIAGTLYETSFDARVARAYIYKRVVV